MKSDPRWSRLEHVLCVSGSALGSHAGEAEFVVTVDLPGYSGFRQRTYDRPTRTETITVPVQRLDEALGDRSEAVRFVKVDTEGAELEVLQGGRSLIKRDRPIVSFEFGMNSAAAYDVEPESLHEFWGDLGYIVIDIVARDMDRRSFSESARRQQVWDYLAIPEELAAEALDGYRHGLEDFLGVRPWV